MTWPGPAKRQRAPGDTGRLAYELSHVLTPPDAEATVGDADGPIEREADLIAGVDLGSVRLHTDMHAAEAAALLGARAFIAGGDIGFASGEFRPDAGAGRRLLAHER
jgi:hypothetical protein